MPRARALFGVLLLLALVATQAQEIVIDNLDPTRFSSSLSGGSETGVVILMYHGLDAEHGYNPADFQAQMQYLADNGFETITLDHLRSWIETGAPALPPKPIVLTFDDNYLSIYTVAFPTLQSHGFVGVNFTHTDYVGVVTSFDHADWNEINQMEAAGVIFTESHSRTHPNLTTLAPAQLDDELQGSMAAIETNIPGKDCRHLAYPYGAYDANVISHSLAAGYVTAVTTLGGLNTRSTPLMELRRFGVNPDTPLTTFQSIVNQSGSLGGGSEWTHSTSEPEFHGTDYQYAAAGGGEAVAQWTFTLAQTGLYRVDTWYTDHSNRATNAPYTVQHRDGETTVRINQTAGGGAWVPLGEFHFTGGEYYTVKLTNDADGYVIAAAVRITFVAVPVGVALFGSE